MVHWLVRNAQIFQTASMPLDLLWDRIRLLASLWCSANGCLCVCVCVCFVGGGGVVTNLRRDWAAIAHFFS